MWPFSVHLPVGTRTNGAVLTHGRDEKRTILAVLRKNQVTGLLLLSYVTSGNLLVQAVPSLLKTRASRGTCLHI